MEVGWLGMKLINNNKSRYRMVIKAMKHRNLTLKKVMIVKKKAVTMRMKILMKTAVKTMKISVKKVYLPLSWRKELNWRIARRKGDKGKKKDKEKE